MTAMSAHIRSPGIARTLGVLAIDELGRNTLEVAAHSNWSVSERTTCIKAIQLEDALCRATSNLFVRSDSIRGDDDMSKVYPSYGGKYTDVVSLDVSNVLKLSEMKYAIKVGGLGMFRNAHTFCQMVSNKFLNMGVTLSSDGENVSPLRVLVVNKRQLPFSIARIQSILSGTYAKGSFSDDGREYGAPSEAWLNS